MFRTNHLMTHSVRSEQPLTDVQLQRYAPSVFATEPWSGMSRKYAFIPTIEVVNHLRASGFQPVEAMQTQVRTPDKRSFTKHLVRFRDMRQGAIQEFGGLYPEAVLVNSHDGESSYTLMGGLLRSICTNGLVIGDHLIEPVKVRHTGRTDDVLDATFEVIEQFPKVLDSVQSFQRLQLAAPEQRAFATAALALKYDEGQAPITAEQLVRPQRSQDAEPTLWNTFNVAQERLLNGGDRYRTSDGRRQRTRGVKGIAENTRLNKALWTLAEELRKLKAS